MDTLTHEETASPQAVSFFVMVRRMLLFALVLSPLAGAITGAFAGFLACLYEPETGIIAGFAIGLETGLLHGVVAAWLVRKKDIVRVTKVLSAGAVVFSTPFALFPGEAKIIAMWIAGIVGFWVTLFAEDAGIVDKAVARFDSKFVKT